MNHGLKTLLFKIWFATGVTSTFKSIISINVHSLFGIQFMGDKKRAILPIAKSFRTAVL